MLPTFANLVLKGSGVEGRGGEGRARLIVPASRSLIVVQLTTGWSFSCLVSGTCTEK